MYTEDSQIPKKPVREIRLVLKLNFKESIHFNRIKSPFKETLAHRSGQDPTNGILIYLKT